jgi:hypothetical protein
VSQTNAPNVVTDVVSSNACVTVDASKEPSVEDDIKSFAEGLAGDADLQEMWTIGTNVVARIAQEDDVAEFRKHIRSLQKAILGIRFREGPMADSYYDWCKSIDVFSIREHRQSAAPALFPYAFLCGKPGPGGMSAACGPYGKDRLSDFHARLISF